MCVSAAILEFSQYSASGGNIFHEMSENVFAGFIVIYIYTSASADDWPKMFQFSGG